MSEGNEMDPSRNLAWEMNSAELVLSSVCLMDWNLEGHRSSRGQQGADWETVGSGMLLAGSEVGQFIYRASLSMTCRRWWADHSLNVHMRPSGKWVVKPQRGRHTTPGTCFAASVIWPERSGLTLCPLLSPCWLGLEPNFCTMPRGKGQRRCLRSRLTNSLTKHQRVYSDDLKKETYRN